MSFDGSEPPRGGIRDRIREKVRLGRMEEAIALSEEALAAARASGDDRDADFALCNHAGLLVSQDRAGEVIPELRRVLMRNADPAIRFLAAYAVSRHHFENRETERGIFYARQAVDQALLEENPEHAASAYNNLANLLVVDSQFAEAAETYRKSLEILDAEDRDDDLTRALMRANLGYCLTILGEVDQAFRVLASSLQAMRRLDCGPWCRFAHLSLSYAFLEAGRYGPARRHARRALALAEQADGARDEVKNALYLLGEAEKLCGDEDAAYDCFYRLQESFYPDEPFVVDVLLATDIRNLINLMA